MTDKKDIRKGAEIVFADGKKRIIFPLTIKSLKKFIKIFNKLNTSDALAMTEEDIDTMIEAAQIILEKVDPVLAEDIDAVAEAVDVVSFQKMVGVAMGNSSPEE